MNQTAQNVKKELQKLAHPAKAKLLQGFFKTGKGEYGEGDVFLGITVPMQRKVAFNFNHLPLREIKKLLQSRVHEHRFTALEILVFEFISTKDESKKELIAKFYLANSNRINNWDLVDTSASYILGEYFYNKNRAIVYKLAKSKNLWQRRIAILATFYFLRRRDFKDILKLSVMLLNDKQDLIQKALGWMLRETGKVDEKVLTKFLDKYSKKMPRTMLRYSIERLNRAQKNKYMKR